MKSKFYTLWAALCLLILLPANLPAADYSQLKILGFSRDGKYLAFAEYGTGDATGYPFASISLVDVEKNAFVAKPFRVSIENEKATEEAAMRKVEAQAARKMRALGIVPGNSGQLVAARLLTDLTGEERFPPAGEPQKIRFNDYLSPNILNTYEFYELTLKSVPVTKGCDEYYDYYKLELTLDHLIRGEKSWETHVLQKDAELPAGRGCPMSYRIERVYSYKNKIAVFINVFTQGWEGADMSYMVVTGNLRRNY